MIKPLYFVFLGLVLGGCGQTKKAEQTSFVPSEKEIVENRNDSVSALSQGAETEFLSPLEADNLFDDFIFAYATDSLLQRVRTRFPLSCSERDTLYNISAETWKHNSFFTEQSYYAQLFANEREMELASDTTLQQVQVEQVDLKRAVATRCHFERSEGMWNLVRLTRLNSNQEKKEPMADFFNFYAQFATDSVYQQEHVASPLRYVTIDPDDEFSILETTLDASQWLAFRPQLPTESLTIIRYGEENKRMNRSLILKLNGVGNGFSNLFYFRKRTSGWQLYKYEDAGT